MIGEAQMTRIQTYVQVLVHGTWKASKKPRWVIQEELCRNFPLCNRKIPSKKAIQPSRFRYKIGYCTKDCFDKYKNKSDLKQQKLKNFLQETDPID